MKKYILFTLIIFFAFISAGCLKKESEPTDLETIIKRGYLIAGVKEDSPPFGFYRDNKLQGIDIEIAQYIANNIFQNNSPANIQFVKINPQNRISTLNSKEVDILVATMSVNEKRKLVINFSVPYFTASQKLMVRKNSKISHIQYFNTSGQLGVVLGTTG
ncbi:transporter substrate-binding domain-containing protein [bacterium]|nr:transporter substrate-binding domain-containing protein [bacterium]